MFASLTAAPLGATAPFLLGEPAGLRGKETQKNHGNSCGGSRRQLDFRRTEVIILLSAHEMTREAIDSRPTRQDRRKPILILSDDPFWLKEFKTVIGNRHRTETPTNVSLNDLSQLSQQRWKLVFMDSVGATIDQRSPLEALQRWFVQPNNEPVVILSALPSPQEAREAMHTGATWYSQKPYDHTRMEAVLKESLKSARIARVKKSVGSVRYQQVLAASQK